MPNCELLKSMLRQIYFVYEATVQLRKLTYLNVTARTYESYPISNQRITSRGLHAKLRQKQWPKYVSGGPSSYHTGWIKGTGQLGSDKKIDVTFFLPQSFIQRRQTTYWHTRNVTSR